METSENRASALSTYISAEVVAVAEDPEEVGDEEGAEHEDGGEESRVGVGLLPPSLLKGLTTQKNARLKGLWHGNS